MVSDEQEKPNANAVDYYSVHAIEARLKEKFELLGVKQYELTDDDRKNIENWFGYHPPTADQAKRYEIISNGHKEEAVTALLLSPPSADRTAALRDMRTSRMVVNQSLACNEPDARAVASSG